MIKWRCDKKIFFRFEAKGFELGFTCEKEQGHTGYHEFRGVQRQIEGDLLPFKIDWHIGHKYKERLLVPHAK